MKKLNEIRIDKGYKTQEQLAHELKTNRVNVARWESGERFPRPQMLIELSKVLGVPERDIITAITAAKACKA